MPDLVAQEESSILKLHSFGIFAALLFLGSAVALADGIDVYGDKDCLGFGCYTTHDPTAGATMQGLAPGTISTATSSFGHGYPFSPGASDFAGTDQIYVGSSQTGSHDGYSTYAGRVHGPQVLTLNYANLVTGSSVTNLTLGIAADDFQNASFGQPYTATINGITDTALTAHLNALSETGPLVQFFTIGIPLSELSNSNVLTLSINEGGDGGDGWAVDFLTVGVNTAGGTAVPEPSTIGVLGAAAVGAFCLVRRRRSSQR
jgi:hypothetical protein